jgi:hypothetical protein
LEYSNNLQEVLSRQIMAAHEEVKNFEGTVRTMIAEIQDGESSREALAKMSSSMDEIRIKFMRVQDDVGKKADTDEMFSLINTMSGDLRSSLSKTPQMNKLRDILKKKADVADVQRVHDEVEAIGNMGSSLPPALTRSTCLTCNRPRGKRVGLGGGGGGEGGGDWRRPPTSVAEQHRLGSEGTGMAGKQVMVLNKDVPISSLKKLSDSNSRYAAKSAAQRE